MTVISGTLIGPYGEALPGVTIEMVAVRTTATVLEQASSRFVTDTNGRYSLKVEPGRYNVMVSASGQPAARVGSILVELTSSTGTLNDFLTKPGEEDLTPEIVKTVDQMRAAAANSAAEAKVSENNSAAAMKNALSKVSTADQSVASAVKFNQSVTIVGDLIKGPPLAGGASIIRFYNLAGEEKGALYSSPSGKMTIRWGGQEHSAVFNEDGTTVFPADVFVGTSRLLRLGEGGIGAFTPVQVTDLDAAGVNQFFRFAQNTPGAPNTSAWGGIMGGYDGASRFKLCWAMGSNTVDLRTQVRNPAGVLSPWVSFRHSGNTTVDANGFIKAASPIVKLFGTGESELNDQSQGVITERISEGVYRVSGVLGFNGDGAWGGVGNGIEIPVDDNKRPLIWVESKVLPAGDIEIRTYHRTYDTGPYSARNIEAMDSGEVDKKMQPIFVEMPDGTPIDIPVGRFIDLRVEMPAVDEPEPDLEPELEPELETEPEAVEPTEPTIPEPGVDPEPSPAVAEEGDELDRPVSDRKPIF